MQYGLRPETIKELISYSLKAKPAKKEDWHITRLAMYRALRDKFSPMDSSERKCLAISNSVWFGKILGLKTAQFTPADYPEYNILNLPFPDESFDFVISDQVLEHVEGDPFTAFRETVRLLKKGGTLCHTTCFINEIHGVPKDFWRYTPDALRLLAKTSECEIVEVGSWGNREAWALIEAGFRFSKIPNDENHPIFKIATRNEPKWPIVTWIIARKP